jgi:hypothetical protein
MEMTQVVDQLRAQLAETEANAQRLRTAIEALEGSGVQTSTDTRVRPRGRRAVRGRAARSGSSNGRTAGKAALSPDAVIKVVTVEGVPAREIRAQVSGSDNQVLKVLKDLESEGKIKRTGQRRATRWHRVTDNGQATGGATNRTAATLSAKRSAAGRKGAAARKARQRTSEPTTA